MERRGSGSVEDAVAAPESWEAADVEESMKRLMLSSSKNSSTSSSSGNAPALELGADDSGAGSENSASGLYEDAISHVDQFLREALQNPRERLSILRMEQDVLQFIRDPTRDQMEFQQLPTSYLRLAAHRVAQHYFLQSMVLLDNNLPDGSGSRIIVRKTSTECRLPRIRLADIPVNLPQEDSGVVMFAIKQRPHKHSPVASNPSSSAKMNNSKSVEERKEEYNKARARIFNSTNHHGSGPKPESEAKKQDNLRHSSVVMPKSQERPAPGVSQLSIGRGIIDSSSGSSRSARGRVEKDPVNRHNHSNKVAIFRDHDIDRKDPDYDRSYDRYMQRFDPGFGFNAGPYTIQPMYTPVVNYNTEFPQLAPTHGPHIPTEHPQPIPQHLPGPWASPSSSATIGYGHPETAMAAYGPNHVGARSASAIYLHSSQFPFQRPGMPFVHPQDHIHQQYGQSHHQQHDATLRLARPH